MHPLSDREINVQGDARQIVIKVGNADALTITVVSGRVAFFWHEVRFAENEMHLMTDIIELAQCSSRAMISGLR